MKQSLLMKQHSLLQLWNLALSSLKELNQVFLYGRDNLLLKSQMKGNPKFSIYWTSSKRKGMSVIIRDEGPDSSRVKEQTGLFSTFFKVSLYFVSASLSSEVGH